MPGSIPTAQQLAIGGIHKALIGGGRLYGVIDVNGCIGVYAQAQDGSISYNNFLNTAWMGWNRIPNPPASMAQGSGSNCVVATNGMIEVFTKSSDGHVLCTVCYNGQWTSWVDCGTPTGAKVDQLLGALPNGTPGFYVTATDGSYWCTAFNGSTWIWAKCPGAVVKVPIVNSFTPATGLVVYFADGINVQTFYTPNPADNTAATYAVNIIRGLMEIAMVIE